MVSKAIEMFSDVSNFGAPLRKRFPSNTARPRDGWEVEFKEYDLQPYVQFNRWWAWSSV